MPTSALPISAALTTRIDGRPLLLLLDIDGTLAPIAPRPEDAIVPSETRVALEQLVALDGVHVAFVTGRSAADGRRLVGVDGAWVIGNHGMELARPGAEPQPRADVAAFAESIAAAAAEITVLAVERGWSGVVVEDKRFTLSAHYRLAIRTIVAPLTDEITRIAEARGLRVTHGKEVLEVRPPIAADKGTAALELAETLGATHAGASLFAAGDDRTDEDMFRVLRAHQASAVTVRVGVDASASTAAEFIVADTDEMRALLEALTALRRRAPV